MVELVIDDHVDRGWTVLAVQGEVDILTAPSLRERIEDASSSETPMLLIDLTSVSFLDSSGLGVLVSALKRVKERGGRLALAASTRPVLHVLSLTGLDKVFEIHPSAQDVPTVTNV